MKTIQIGDVFGDVKSVEVDENATLRQVLQTAGLALSQAQQLLANSTSQPVNLEDTPFENEVYLITSNQSSAK